MKKKNQEIVVGAYKINYDTGEVTQASGKFITDEQLEAQRAYTERKTQHEEIHKDYGAFIWLLFEYSKELLPNIKPASLSRLIYLSTYLNYKGYLSFDNNVAITRKNIQEKLNLSKNVFSAFWKELKDNQILTDKCGLVYLNPNIFCKGKASNIDSDFTRICVKGVRDIYEHTEPKAHKQLSYIFRILPYVNRRYNIVCYNPQETDITQITPMKVTVFCEIVGYEANHAADLIKKLGQCKYADKAILKYLCDRCEPDNCRIFINPKVYYGGDDYKRVEVIGEF
ncbi:hypothetical protein [Faecalispora jeddahensis]|uniref:hypothetical protein n=1 Tax=Faecalispora jeddahensis TaxID=1414721 RepID=UPI00145B534A|nr:hypothetical protein [Faecalispora jeddahensis]